MQMLFGLWGFVFLETLSRKEIAVYKAEQNHKPQRLPIVNRIPARNARNKLVPKPHHNCHNQSYKANSTNDVKHCACNRFLV